MLQSARGEINIWEDLAAAAAVHAITGGAETVPAVMVGAKAMVNPSAARSSRRCEPNCQASSPQRALRRHPGSRGWLACSPAAEPGRSLPLAGAASPGTLTTTGA